jgi:hypothetical protein
MKQFSVPCSACLRDTTHDLLHETSRRGEDRIWTYAMMQCCGCGDVCLAEQVIWTDDGTRDVRYYPPPVSRKKPAWLVSLMVIQKQSDLAALLEETYQALYGGQNRLAAMGIRALLEQIMISKAGDNGTFEKNLDAFQAGGYISLVQRDALNNILQLGHAAMHRGFHPDTAEVTTAIDIVEGVMAAIYYYHQAAAQGIADRVPRRPSRQKSDRPALC